MAARSGGTTAVLAVVPLGPFIEEQRNPAVVPHWYRSGTVGVSASNFGPAVPPAVPPAVLPLPEASGTTAGGLYAGQQVPAPDGAVLPLHQRYYR